VTLASFCSMRSSVTPLWYRYLGTSSSYRWAQEVITWEKRRTATIRPARSSATRTGKFDSECCAEIGFVDTCRPKAFDQSGKDGDAGAAALKHATGTLEHGNLPAEPVKQIAGNETDQRSTHHDHSPAVGVESSRHWFARISHQLGCSVDRPDCSSASLTIAM
jgi:hypothetical protein